MTRGARRASSSAMELAPRAAVNAFTLWRAGLSVIPINAGTKVPAIAWEEYQKRLPTKDEMELWFAGERCHKAWAVICGEVSGIVVVDLDSREALDWAEANLPKPALRVGTGTKPDGFRGRHWYYRHPGLDVRNRAKIRTDVGQLALDVRGDRGYVIGPGSPHPTGAVYEALIGSEMPTRQTFTREMVDSLPLFDPAWIADPVTTPPVTERSRATRQPGDGPTPFERAQGWMAEREPAIQGQRGDPHTFCTACGLVRGYRLSDEDAMVLLLDWNNTCVPPWTERELRQKIASAHKSGTEPYGYLLDVPRRMDVLAREKADWWRSLQGSAADAAPSKKPAVDSAGQPVADAGDAGPTEPITTEAVWAEPRPLDHDASQLPAFPTEVLPPVLADFVRAQALSTQVDEALPAFLVLGALSVALAGKAEVHPTPDWQEPLNTYLTICQDSGTRKSPNVKRVMRPVVEFEQQLQTTHKQATEGNSVQIRVLKNHVTQLEAQLNNSKGTRDDSDVIAELIETQGEVTRLEQENLKVCSRLLADDITPEACAVLLHKNRCRIGVVSAEADIFKILAGRYSQEANLGLFLKGYSGDDYRMDRRAADKEPIWLPKPLITMAIATQPAVLQEMVNQPGWKEMGLPGRFLYASPVDLVGRRAISPPSMPPSVEKAYQALMRQLLDIPIPDEPFAVHLGDSARDALDSFRAWLEPQMAGEGRFRDMREWASKLPGNLVRIAGLLHIAERAHLGYEGWRHVPIGTDVIDRVLWLAEFLIEHATAVFTLMGADKVREDARKILTWVKRKEIDSFTRRECIIDMRRVFKATEDTDPALTFLEHAHYLKSITIVGERKQWTTTRYLVNPKVLGWTQPAVPALPRVDPGDIRPLPIPPIPPADPEADASDSPAGAEAPGPTGGSGLLPRPDGRGRAGGGQATVAGLGRDKIAFEDVPL